MRPIGGEMITPLMIYLANLCDDINLMLEIVLVFLLALLICGILSHKYEDTEEKEESILCMKAICILSSIIVLIIILVPSTNTVYQMMIVPTITNSQIVQKLPDEIQKYIDKTIGESK